MLFLKKLHSSDGVDIYNMLQEIALNDNGFNNKVNGMNYDEFKIWLLNEYEVDNGKLKDWMVPQSSYWLFDDAIPVGYGRIRHYLNDALAETGGHIGYAIASLKEKIIIGVSTTTSNDDPQMGEKIGGLWTELYQGGVNSKIKNKMNEYAIGLYSDYTENGYVVTAGNEVSKSENSEFTTKIIPAGKYAKFSVHGHMEKAVAKAWGEIWQMNLDRSFTGDFEEYLNCDFENCDIDLYIALK